MTRPSYHAPAEVGERFGISTSAVLSLIRSGALPAVNVSPPGTRRPRYRISESDIAEFLERRAVRPPAAPARRRKRADTGVTQYF